MASASPMDNDSVPHAGSYHRTRGATTTSTSSSDTYISDTDYDDVVLSSGEMTPVNVDSPPSSTTSLLIKGKAPLKDYSSCSYPGRSPALSTITIVERTPFPYKAMSTVLIGMMAEPIVASVMDPFINQLISETGITGGDDTKIGYYAGFIKSTFFLAQVCSVLFWGRVSDIVGRKPVLITGLLGMVLSSIFIGLSKTFPGILMSRAVAGLLSGNTGVFKSVISELTDETNRSQGFAMISVMWMIGLTIGPVLGGFLCEPSKQYPTIFISPFWDEYPYFLPCLAAAGFTLASIIALALFLEETLESKRKQPIADEEEDLYNQVNKTLAKSSSSQNQPRPSLREVLTPRVVVAISNYAALALLDVAFGAIRVLFYATAVPLGGMGLSPWGTGIVLGFLGMTIGLFQGIFGPTVQRIVGVKRLFVIGIWCFLIVYATFPLIHNEVLIHGITLYAWFLVAIQIIAASICELSYGCIFLVISCSADRSTLGTVNGAAQMLVSLVRTFGPAGASCLFAWSHQLNFMGGNSIYAVLSVMVLLCVYVARRLPPDCV